MSGLVNFGKENNSNEFVRQGPLKKMTSFPLWVQEIVAECQDIRDKATKHLFWELFASGKLTQQQIRRFLVGFWPVVEQFPRYMAMNLVKAPYAESRGEEMAREWLIRNIRVEQNHAKYWINWLEAHEISADEIKDLSDVPSEIMAMSGWCWQVCEKESLATAMTATNYAIEGITGEWAYTIMSHPEYVESFDESIRDKALKWLSLHAEYDDEHPWEALEIVSTILGNNPSEEDKQLFKNHLYHTYELAVVGLNACIREKVSESRCELAA